MIVIPPGSENWHQSCLERLKRWLVYRLPTRSHCMDKCAFKSPSRSPAEVEYVARFLRRLIEDEVYASILPQRRNILSCNYEITLVIQLQLNRFGKRAPMDRSTMVRFGRAPMDRSTMVRLVKLPPLSFVFFWILIAVVSCVELYYRFGKRAPLERSSMVRFGKRAPMDRASMVRWANCIFFSF